VKVSDPKNLVAYLLWTMELVERKRFAGLMRVVSDGGSSYR
jgi:hypothetical protein